MNYFFKTFKEGQKTFWIAMTFVAMWIFALADAARPASYFKGYFFDFTLIVTVVGSIFLAFLSYKKSRDAIIDELESEKVAAIFEPTRETEIRRELQKDPNFATHCFQCLFFSPQLQSCSRQFEDRASNRRVKDIRINDRKYCLYWRHSDAIAL